MKKYKRRFVSLFAIAAFSMLGMTSFTYAADASESEVSVEQTTEDAITFRSIPWGTSYQEFLDSYNEFEMNINADPYISIYVAMPSDENEKIKVYGNGFGVSNEDGAGFNRSVGNYSDTVCTVAGYNVKNVEYGFVLSIDETTGYVNRDIDTAKFIRGEYSFEKMSDATAMAEDLKTKLSSIYGEISDSNTSTYSSGETHFQYMWEDGSGDWIVLSHNSDPDEPDNVYIQYFSGKIFEWTAQITDAYLKEEAETFEAPSGVEGL